MSKKQLNVAAIQNELSQSVYFARSSQQSTPKPKLQSAVANRLKTNKPKQTSEVRKSRSAEVPQSGSPVVPKSRSYELRKYDKFRRLDVRLTREQLRFLQDMEEDIRETMPEVEQGNPEHRRITKSSIVRVYVEMFRQFDLKIDARQFHNEHDLMNALHSELISQLPKFGSSEVRK